MDDIKHCPLCGSADLKVEPTMRGGSDVHGPLVYWRCGGCSQIVSRLTDRATISLRDTICPNCGNDDSERMLTVTKPYVQDGRLVGQTLLGLRCAVCSDVRVLPYVITGKPADAPSQRSD